MTSDQEVVCGTCGGSGSVEVGDTDYGALYADCDVCNGTGRIPAPVVPSDERCECAHVEADHRDRGANYQRGACYAVDHVDDGVYKHCACRAFKPAPPTPSQDAESDGPRPGYVRIRTGEGDNYRDWDIPEVVESAIREPYEAEVKRLREVLDRVLSSFKRALAGGVIRDADEVIAEAEAALATPPSEGEQS